MDRYAARQSESAFGIWDAAVSGWHGQCDLMQLEAVERVDRLNGKITGPEPDYRDVEPRWVTVEVDGLEHQGVLDAWSRLPDEWWGRVVITAEAPTGWYPASVLRKA